MVFTSKLLNFVAVAFTFEYFNIFGATLQDKDFILDLFDTLGDDDCAAAMAADPNKQDCANPDTPGQNPPGLAFLGALIGSLIR